MYVKITINKSLAYPFLYTCFLITSNHDDPSTLLDRLSFPRTIAANESAPITAGRINVRRRNDRSKIHIGRVFALIETHLPLTTPLRDVLRGSTRGDPTHTHAHAHTLVREG